MLFWCGAYTWVPRWPRRGPLPAASCATEEHLHYAALLWREFVAFGDHGSMWLEYVALTAQLQEAYRKFSLERLRTFASGTLRSALATLTRWRTWSHDAACTGFPSALPVALWLRSLQDGSPTSAHTAWTALRWLESHLGVVFHAAAPSVKALSAVGGLAEVRQAVPLSYRQWLLIETRALESDGLHRQLLASWLLMLYGMVRFEHLQHPDIWMESGVLTGQSTGRRDGMADGAPFAGRLCQRDSRARWSLCGLLSVGLQGLATSWRYSRRMA